MARQYADLSQASTVEPRPQPADALAAARRKFLHLERVDMNELANDLGVGRATLYRWVRSRDALLGEVLWSLSEHGLAMARARAKGDGVDWFLSIYNAFGDVIVESAHQLDVAGHARNGKGTEDDAVDVRGCGQ